MAIKKTELYRFLYASCDELRGGMHASQYIDGLCRVVLRNLYISKTNEDLNGI